MIKVTGGLLIGLVLLIFAYYRIACNTPKYQYFYFNTYHAKTKEYQERLIKINKNGKEILKIEIYNNISIQIFNHKSKKSHSILLKDLKSVIILEILSDDYKLVALRKCDDDSIKSVDILNTKDFKKMPLKIVIDIYNILMNIIEE